ncbi:MAG: hypothetical protein OXC07_02440 [Kistimonas sp.]|nr:hypothetical protein [Kistimonas sp.]
MAADERSLQVRKLQALHAALLEQQEALERMQPEGIASCARQALAAWRELSALQATEQKPLLSRQAAEVLRACRHQCLVNQQHLKLLADLCRRSLAEPDQDSSCYSLAHAAGAQPAVSCGTGPLLVRA